MIGLRLGEEGAHLRLHLGDLALEEHFLFLLRHHARLELGFKRLADLLRLILRPLQDILGSDQPLLQLVLVVCALLRNLRELLLPVLKLHLKLLHH